MFYIGEEWTNQYIDTLLYKRYIDHMYINNKHESTIGGYYPAIVAANAHIISAEYPQELKDRSGNIYIPFMRCAVYCEYSYLYYDSNKDENIWKNKIIFDAQGYQNQNIGRLNPNNGTIGNSAIGFNKSVSEETIMYTVDIPEKESVGSNTKKKAIYCWYYSPKTGLRI
jgi:hypothetical protein